MAVVVLYRADILMDGVSATTDMNRVKLTTNQEIKAITAFGDVARHFLPGVYKADAEGDFYYQTGLNMIPNLLESEFASGSLPTFTAEVITISDTPTEGGLTHIFQGAVATVEHTGQHGEVLKGTFKTTGAILGRAVMGTRLLRTAVGAATSALGTPFNVGAVGALQAVYGALNVIATTGTPAGTVFTVVSAASSGMGGATTRLTFVAGTSARAGEWQNTAAGAITDTWWAAKYTGYAGTGFTASISIGIQ